MYPERVTESKGANIGGQGRLATVLGIGLVVLTLCFVVHAVVCTLQIAALREEVAQLQKWKLSLEDGRQGSAADDDTGSRGIHTHARGRKVNIFLIVISLWGENGEIHRNSYSYTHLSCYHFHLYLF